MVAADLLTIRFKFESRPNSRLVASGDEDPTCLTRSRRAGGCDGVLTLGQAREVVSPSPSRDGFNLATGARVAQGNGHIFERR